MGVSTDRIKPRGENIYFKLYFNDEETTWTNRILSWSPISRECEAHGGKFKISDFSVSLADHDQDLTGSFASISPLNRKVQAKVSFDNSDWYTVYTGLIEKAKYEDEQVRLDVVDNVKKLKDARFVWDYQNIGSTINGTNYGVVSDFCGSVIYINDVYGTQYFTRNKLMAWYTWENIFVPNGLDRRLHDLNLIPEDSFAEGDFIKIYDGSISSSIAGSTLKNVPYYKINSGTWLDNIGTIVVDRQIENIKKGYSIYKRRDLVFSGNPGSILWKMLTGTNIDPKFGEIDFDMTELGLATVALSPMNLSKRIDNEGDNAVINEVTELCESCLAYFYVNDENKFVFRPWRPRKLEDSVEHYQQSDQILQSGFSISDNLDDVWTTINVKYAYSHENIDDRTQYGGLYTKTFNSNAIALNNAYRTKTIESRWIQDGEVAAVIAGRYGARYRDGRKVLSIPTTLYGIQATLGQIIQVTHRTGNLSARWCEITKVNKDLGQKNVDLEVEDVENPYRGYAWWGKNSGVSDDYGACVETITSTSCFGWGKLHADNPCPIFGTGTCYNMNVSKYGSLAWKWW